MTTRRLWHGLLLTGLLAAGCGESERLQPGERGSVRTLRELSREQRHVFLKGYAGDWRADTDRSRGLPPPPIEKACPPDARLVDLASPGNMTLGRMSLATVIGQRRSRREYTAASLTNEELSFLLWSTQGMSRTDTNGAGQVVNQYRTVPSGGARHPFESYLIVNRVDGMSPGLYRYLPVEHKLVFLREQSDLPSKLVQACYGQEHAGTAAVVFVWAAVPRRTEWAYGYVAPRLIAVDAGHVGQNLYLAAESIGAGACAILGYDQASMDALIGVDGAEEFTIYLASVGKVSSTP